MTRRELEVTDQKEINRILDTCKYLHLGLVDEGMPYVVPLNYGFEYNTDGKLILWLHGATKGYKIDVIKKNPNCCFTMECNVAPFPGKMACQYGMTYECVMGKGQIHLIDDVTERAHALNVIMKTQTGRDDFTFDERMVSIVSIMKIEVDELTAKKRPLPATLEQKSLLIIGYGEYGHLVEEMAKECGYSKIAALDDNAEDAMDTISSIEKYKNVYTDFVVAIGNPDSRKEIAERIAKDMNQATLIHPKATISKDATIEQGCIIEQNVVVHRGTTIKQATIINAGAVINHDSTVGEYSQIGCNAVVAARAQVPPNTKVMHCQCFNNDI